MVKFIPLSFGFCPENIRGGVFGVPAPSIFNLEQMTTISRGKTFFPIGRSVERGCGRSMECISTITVCYDPRNETWVTRLMLPSGKRFFPDFVVGVVNRTSKDSIALIEIKDDGSTGRLQLDNNIEKDQGSPP